MKFKNKKLIKFKKKSKIWNKSINFMMINSKI